MRVISAIYVISLIVIIFCAPVSGILLLIKACADVAYSWLTAVIPLIIALAVLPAFLLCKIIIDAAGKGE